MNQNQVWYLFNTNKSKTEKSWITFKNARNTKEFKDMFIFLFYFFRNYKVLFFFLKTSSSSSFKFTAKLRGRCREFLRTPAPPLHSMAHHQPPWEWWTSVGNCPKPTVYIRAPPHSVGLDTSTMTCIHHNSVAQNHSAALKTLCASPDPLPFPRPWQRWSFHFICSFAFFRMSYSWNPL